MLAPSLVIRPTRPADASAVVAMVARCSPASLRRRFLSPMPSERAARWLAASLTDGGLSSWLAEVDGAVVGIATAADLRAGEAELALLVEDGWQRRGVGAALARAAVDAPRPIDLRRVRVSTFVERLPVVVALARLLGGRVRGEVASGVAEVAIEVGSHPSR